MILREKVGKIRKVEHVAHYIGQAILSLNLCLSVVISYVPKLKEWVDLNSEVLHKVHLISLVLFLLAMIVQRWYQRVPSETIAAVLPLGNAGEGDDPYEYRGRELSISDRKFVDKPDGEFANILRELNSEGYDCSRFEMYPEEIRLRNSQYIKKNPNVFMCFLNANEDFRGTNFRTGESARLTINDFVGYTCVLPLNETGKMSYLEGNIPDRALPEPFVCKQGEVASGLLFFAMHLRSKYQDKKTGPAFGALLWRCVEYHISLVAMEHAGSSKEIDVWVQAESPRIEKVYNSFGFRKTEKSSAEGFPLYRRRNKVPSFVVLPPSELAEPEPRP